MTYAIGEEVISLHRSFYYLKKGRVVGNSSAIVFKVNMFHDGRAVYFYHDQVANAKEFLQLQLEGRIL